MLSSSAGGVVLDESAACIIPALPLPLPVDTVRAPTFSIVPRAALSASPWQWPRPRKTRERSSHAPALSHWTSVPPLVRPAAPADLCRSPRPQAPHAPCPGPTHAARTSPKQVSRPKDRGRTWSASRHLSDSPPPPPAARRQQKPRPILVSELDAPQRIIDGHLVAIVEGLAPRVPGAARQEVAALVQHAAPREQAVGRLRRPPRYLVVQNDKVLNQRRVRRTDAPEPLQQERHVPVVGDELVATVGSTLLTGKVSKRFRP